MAATKPFSIGREKMESQYWGHFSDSWLKDTMQILYASLNRKFPLLDDDQCHNCVMYALRPIFLGSAERRGSTPENQEKTLWALLWKRLHFAAIDALTESTKHPVVPLHGVQEAHTDAVSLAVYEDLNRRFNTVVASLPKTMQCLIQLCQEGYSTAEIARDVNRSESQVRRLRVEALELLKRTIEDQPFA